MNSLEIKLRPADNDERSLVIVNEKSELASIVLPFEIAEFIQAAVREKINRENAAHPLLHRKVRTIERFKSISTNRDIEAGTEAEIVAVYNSKYKGLRVSIRIDNSYNVSTSADNVQSIS